VLRHLERLDVVRGRGWNWVLVVGVAFLFGVAVGYLVVAPEALSWLVTDIRTSEMLVAWRVTAYIWLVLMLTIGVGGLVALPIGVVAAWQLGVSVDLVLRWRAVFLAVVIGGSVAGGVVEMAAAVVVVMPVYAGGAAAVWMVADKEG